MFVDNANPEFFAAMAGAQSEIENASKSSVNPHFKNKYADLAEVLNTVRPVFAKHGLSILQSTAMEPGVAVSVTTVIGHKAGGYVTSVASCVPAKWDAQGIGAATTYLRRYSLAAMAGVSQEDDDGNAASHNRPAPAAVVRQPSKALTDILASIESITNVDDLAAVRASLSSLSDEERNIAITAGVNKKAALASKAVA